MAFFKSFPLVLGLVVLLVFARPTHAFGAGNIAGISKVEGQNWRHGDIEDTLLKILMARAVSGKKFDKMMVSRVYFGNWLRDYSQAIDVGTVKAVSAEAIRLLLCVLGFLSFGYGSREFEVTADRLGCYRPEDHIDNPKNYADNLDARNYDRRLRGPVDEGVELAVDEETGLKNYIANEGVGIVTSAGHVRGLFSKCIELGRSYQQSRDKSELYEALRLMGTGLHCLEDFLAHSNYTELALIEMGERDVFPHVGRRTRIRVRGARNEVYPCVTGTFGSVDFLHSVTGEVSDKLIQNEIQELEGTLQASSNNDTSMLQELLDKIPSGLFGGDKKEKMEDIQSNAQAAQLQNMSVSPRDPEEFTQWVQQIFQQVMPAIEFHDEILQGISEAIEKIPVLPQLIEQLEDQLSVFVFSVIAPFVVPVINQIKNELSTGSMQIIESSQNEQYIVFDDDNSTDPTHSMLSKDHFSNILNEIAGRTASKVLQWVVPQLMDAWDNHDIDVDRTLNRIVTGVLHHPAQRDMGEDGARDCRALMFQSVEEWWRGMDEGQQFEYRSKLSRDGVKRGENHKEGVHDSGHGCGKPLGMHKNYGNSGGDVQDQIASAAAGAIIGGVTSGISNIVESQTGIQLPGSQQQQQSSGDNGSGLGGILGAVAGSLLGGGFKSEETDTFTSSGRTNDGGYTQTTTQYGHSGNRYAQAEFTETELPGGGERTDYRRYEQDEPPAPRPQYGGQSGDRYQQSQPVERDSFYEQVTETRPAYGGGFEERTERRWEDNRGEFRREEETSRWGGGGRDEYSGREENYGRREEFGRQSDNDRRDEYGSREEFGRRGDDFGGRREEFGRPDEGFGRRQEESFGDFGGRREEGGWGERREEGGGGMFGGAGGFMGEMARQAEETFGGDRRDEDDEYNGRRRGERRDYGGY